jgi:glycerophosphoryl diester phosphodiesterase
VHKPSSSTLTVEAALLSPDESLVTPEQVAAAHKAGLQVAPYTVNAIEGWQKMADAKVDAVITDDPVGLLEWLRAQKPSLHKWLHLDNRLSSYGA